MIITLFNNRDIELREIETYDISYAELARPLSFLNRYGGHTLRPLSVLEHSYKLSLTDEVVAGGRQMIRAALAHDCSEGLLVDLPRPIKNDPEFSPYCELEERIQRHLFRLWNIPWKYMEQLAPLDSRICQDETIQLRPGHDGYGMQPMGVQYELTETPWHVWYQLTMNRAAQFNLK